MSFDAALNYLVEASDGPLAEEIGRVMTELRVGESRRDRAPAASPSVSEARTRCAFANAVARLGSARLAARGILRAQAADLRHRRQMHAEEQAQKAPVKMLFPIAIFILPVMFVVILAPAFLGERHPSEPLMSASRRLCSRGHCSLLLLRCFAWANFEHWRALPASPRARAYDPRRMDRIHVSHSPACARRQSAAELAWIAAPIGTFAMLSLVAARSRGLSPVLLRGPATRRACSCACQPGRARTLVWARRSQSRA